MNIRESFRNTSVKDLFRKPASVIFHSAIIYFLLSVLVSGCSPVGDNLYLGQKTPGSNVEVFAPGIVSTDEFKEFNCTISNDAKEIYFTRKYPEDNKFRILFSRVENGKLTSPEPPAFAFDGNETSASITMDGKWLYYASSKPLTGENTAGGQFNNWKVERIGNEWQTPVLMNNTINRFMPVYMSFSSNGTVYFEGMAQSGIWYSEFRDGKYLEPVMLPEEINYLEGVAHPAIAPDESYIIVDAEDDKNNIAYLYISFKKPDGSWTKAVSLRSTLKAADSDVHAISRITPDGKYLFFENYETENESDIYWVSTEVLEELKAEISK